MSDYKRHFQTNVINDKSQDSVATHLRCGEIFSSHIFYKFIAESASEKNFLNRWTFGKITGKKVDCMFMEQFPVTLMTQMRIIDHSVGWAVWT